MAKKLFEIEVYELHSSKYTVEAENIHEAIEAHQNGESEPVDESTEYIESADEYGREIDQNSFDCSKKDIAELRRELGVNNAARDKVFIPGIRGVQKV